MEQTAKTFSGLNVLIGLWLIFSPLFLNYNMVGNAWQQVAFGIIITVFGAIRFAMPRLAWPSWVNLVSGLWLILAPWVLADSSISSRWNEVILGIVVAVFSWLSLSATNQMTVHHQ